MTEPKPSGLRPPSKIGRPCSTMPPRPAIPPSSPRPVSNQMEPVWESHGRQINEAGLRRGSDTSVVLTEDTDSFKIGDRVWVGGTKPGTIAYIGETKFAPGDWAGVVLDEAIGKNDGSVAGSRYFQCEPKRGIFSRLTRLTRTPLSDSIISPRTTPTTPPDNTRSLFSKSMSQSLNTSTTSLSSTVSQRSDLKIGDRVIVSSSQGSKTGVLRYLGTTEFAPGEWCGVELDEPVGKNDGSVNDKRYFECSPKYGLFAPVHKVSRSPSNKRQSTCVVHKPTGAALNASLKKSGSRESLASLTSSIASNVAARTTASSTASSTTARKPGMRTPIPARGSLQEVLKEKQQEIDFLRKERDLERERVTKAANQADQAEQSALSIKQEYEKYREEVQQKINETETTVTKLLGEKGTLVVQLEEEKRKCEDLLFRFEEESVNKDDIQVINTVNESRIRELEKKLSEERERVVQLERDNIKLFEAEEELTRLRNEINNVTSSQNSQLRDLESRNQSLEEIKGSLEKELQEKSSLVDECVGRIRGLEVVLNEAQRESTTHEESGSHLGKELEAAKKSLQDRETLLENMKLEFERSTSSLNEELRKSKETIERIERESVSEKDSLLSEYRRRIEERDRLIKVKTEDLENESKRLLEQRNALEGLKAENVKYMRELSESFKLQLHAKDSKIEEVTLQLSQKASETETLLNELSVQRELCEKKNEELANALRKLEELSAKLKLAEENNNVLSRQIEDYKSKNDENVRIIQEKQKLEQDLASLVASEEQSTAQLNKLNEELKVKDKELAELRHATMAQIQEITKRFESQINDKVKYIDEINADVVQKTLMLVKLKKDIADLKAIIASKDEEIKHLLEKTSELQDALTLSEQTKTNLESELRVFESNAQSLNQQVAKTEEKISQLLSQKEKLESDIASVISSAADSSEQLSRYNEDLQRKKELDEAREKIFQTENMLKLMQGKLSSAELEMNKSAALMDQLRSEKSSLESQMSDAKRSNADYVEKIRQFERKESELLAKVDEGECVKMSLAERSREIASLLERLTCSEEEIAALRGRCETGQRFHEEEASSLRKKIADLSAELSKFQDEMKNLQKSKGKLEADQSANRWTIEELTEKLNVVSENTLKLEDLLREKDSKLQDAENKLLELRKTNDALATDKEASDKNLTASLNSATSTVKELKNQLKSAEQTIGAKTNEVSKARAEIEKCIAQIAELNTTVSSIGEERTRSSNELKDARESITQQQSVVNELTKAKAALEDSTNFLETQLSSTRGELQKKDKLLIETEVRMKELNASRTEEILKLRNTLESEVAVQRKEIEKANKLNDELEEKLRRSQDIINKKAADQSEKEAAIDDLRAQVKALEDAQVERAKAEQQSRNEEIKQKQSELSGTSKRINELQSTVYTLEKRLREQETKSAELARTMEYNEKEVDKNVQNLVEKLNVAKVEETRLLDELSRLEKENKQVTAKWLEATNQLKLTHENMKNTYDATEDIKQHIVTKDIDVAKLQEENDTTKSQIDFLNSVIVDMQRKNETLLCKIEVLEMGVPSNEADDYNRSTLDKRMAVPRMFCDICDQFDLHETEDCPRQAQDFSESTEKMPKLSKKQPVERPYCENCEMFGHDTRDCDDTETF
ncbi:PREDICTED: restin homolog isoform X2 [Dinoponera quadriceps]|uniref:Restin homolog isoform X2 n=1 Tax=Dinoponera quadriceps TaxID=609295 RepID=A0A6P3Y518_DINQU|nr:PREDICTED: restin homolog isoform X2 [Dinoponera quadriceps]